MKLLASIHLTRFFFLAAGIGVALVGGAFFVPFLGIIGKTILFVLLFALILDVLLVNLHKEPIRVQRKFQERMNLGDENKVVVSVLNQTAQPLQVGIYEGYPLFMQKRAARGAAPWQVFPTVRGARPPRLPVQAATAERLSLARTAAAAPDPDPWDQHGRHPLAAVADRRHRPGLAAWGLPAQAGGDHRPAVRAPDGPGRHQPGRPGGDERGHHLAGLQPVGRLQPVRGTRRAAGDPLPSGVL